MMNWKKRGYYWLWPTSRHIEAFEEGTTGAMGNPSRDCKKSQTKVVSNTEHVLYSRQQVLHGSIDTEYRHPPLGELDSRPRF